jgi:Rieske Fe-S protein
MPNEELDRREFLSRATLVSVGALLAACSGGDGSLPTQVTEGPSSITVTPSQFPALASVGGIAAVGTVLFSPVAVVRTDTSSYLALSRVCTHLQCIINVVPGGFSCPCHGSTYNAQGSVTGGPAPSPLARLNVVVSADGSQLTIS